MIKTNQTPRWCIIVSAALATTAVAGAASAADIAFWDPYPQHADGSEWDAHVKSCAPSGSTIVRSSAPQTDLFNQLTTAVREGNAPHVVLLDNPMVPDAVAAQMLATTEQVGVNTQGVDKNLLGPGVVDGVTYGVPFGSNALGLYYNRALLAEAGIDPETINDWDSLNAAIEAVVEQGHQGITFSGITGEEGVFQFLPWFWGAGANLSDLTSAEAIAAGQLISDWIGNGWAPKSSATDNQSAAWDLFLTGDFGFVENGSWFAAAAANADFDIGVIPIPAKDGGVAPVPTGGEFAVVPVQINNASQHYANAAEVINCLTEGDAAMITNETLGYLSAKPDVRARQVAWSNLWGPWVGSVEGAEGRTTDLGSDYVVASAQLSMAIQGALNAAGDEGEVKSAFLESAGF